jgi:CDGSH-type Zn-finger protein
VPRIVRHIATGPFKIEPAQFPRDEQGNLKPIWICACGLSSTMPLCDKSHKACKDEDPTKVYTYDPVTKARSEHGGTP